MPVRLAPVIREFTRSITSPYDSDDMLDSLLGHVIEVHKAAGAGIMLRGGDGKLGVAAASDDRVREMEMVQDQMEEGACYDAYEADHLIAVSDLAGETRWPTYTLRARQLGIAAVLAIPMHASGQRIGVLNIYCEQRADWTEQDRDNAEVLASMGAAYVAFSTLLQAQVELAEQLQYALDARVVIEQAKGFLMSQRELNDRAAYELMRSYARTHNLRLALVARDILDDKLLL